MRQIAELMCASNNFSLSYAKCLVAATPPTQMFDPETPKSVDGLSTIDMARMEREMSSLGLLRSFWRPRSLHDNEV